MDEDVFGEAREKSVASITDTVKRYTYLDDDAAEALAKSIDRCIAVYVDGYIKSVNLRKYCIEQAARVPCRDLVETARQIEEYIKQEA